MNRKDFERNYELIKALSDVNRLLIINTLSNGELCACKILEKFNITQPTLSHHMRVLSECGLVNFRKEGKWTHYSLNMERVNEFQSFIANLTSVNKISDK
ncbi:metalloregulator ArsR/SmtB family transcription factor [Sedimentibacter sp.]|uniref:ArsR/SmtB family transcription factor n=1 Tax=Sedimentibacter sp. TaxID=1960295 RepID=UPI0028A85538|nr:metalloregulator ArsR/SmtB family transcription factor [Sedimentibacter sp.]